MDEKLQNDGESAGSGLETLPEALGFELTHELKTLQAQIIETFESGNTEALTDSLYDFKEGTKALLDQQPPETEAYYRAEIGRQVLLGLIYRSLGRRPNYIGQLQEARQCAATNKVLEPGFEMTIEEAYQTAQSISKAEAKSTEPSIVEAAKACEGTLSPELIEELLGFKSFGDASEWLTDELSKAGIDALTFLREHGFIEGEHSPG